MDQGFIREALFTQCMSGNLGLHRTVVFFVLRVEMEGLPQTEALCTALPFLASPRSAPIHLAPPRPARGRLAVPCSFLSARGVYGF